MEARPRSLLLVLVGACGFHPRPSSDGGTTGFDGATAYPACFGSGLIQVCLDAPPPDELAPLGSAFDTTSRACLDVTQSDGSTVCVLAAVAVAITSNVAVTGQYPLVLLGTDTISIDGTLDVSSHSSPASMGAGANWSDCNPATAAGPNTGGAGGGAGGSFGAIGGSGGEGNNGAAPNDGTGGLPGSPQIALIVRGGCIGALGATGAVASPGAGGNSGGAVYLLAGTSIEVSASVAANGAGGGFGSDDSGGGGGGAGGLVGLEAPTITVTAIIAANGGGGGGGGDGTPAAGGPGGDGAITTTDAAAGGARTSSYDTEGGAGGVAAIAAGAGADNPGGGGGGGGGVGTIYVKGALTGSALISPSPSLN